MGKKTQKTNSTQTNTYGYMTPPTTPDINALREFKATADPSIAFDYSKRKQQLENSYQNPLGAATSPATHDAMHRATSQSLAQEEAQAREESQWNADSQNFSRQAAIAQMTSPQLIQTGGTMSGNQVQTGGFWSGLLNSTMQGSAGAALG